jgi:hypothetical protein
VKLKAKVSVSMTRGVIGWEVYDLVSKLPIPLQVVSFIPRDQWMKLLRFNQFREAA